MAKSNHLPLILFIAAVWLCSHLSSDSVGRDFRTSPGRTVGFIQNTASLAAQRLLLQSVFTSEIGVREKNNRNDGCRVEEYLAYTANNKGDAWCAAFVCWALGRAGIANPRSAWSPELFPAGRIIWKNSWLSKKEQPQTGDVFGLWFNNKGRIAHCGFIAIWGDSQVITVEGNTNENGSREGDGVYRKRRSVRSLYAVADWLNRKEQQK